MHLLPSSKSLNEIRTDNIRSNLSHVHIPDPIISIGRTKVDNAAKAISFLKDQHDLQMYYR